MPDAPTGRAVAHLCIDMQRLFAEPTDWHTPAMHAIVPNIVRLSRAHAGRSVFARFTVPADAAQASGSWQRYYEHWGRVLAAVQDDRGLIGLMPPLAEIAQAEVTIDKPTYSLFQVPSLVGRLRAWGCDTVLLTGVETDVCVLATLFDAVDLGYHVVVAADAVASSSAEGHEAVMRAVLPRMPQQVDVADTQTILARCH